MTPLPYLLAFVFLATRIFFSEMLEGVCTSSLSCLDYGKVLTNSKGSFWKYFEKKF